MTEWKKNSNLLKSVKESNTPEYLKRTWCPGSLCHDITNHGMVSRCLSSTTMDFNYLHHLSVVKWWKSQIFLYIPWNKSSFTVFDTDILTKFCLAYYKNLTLITWLFIQELLSRNKKNQSSALLVLCERIYQWTVDSPHENPVMQVWF